MDIYDYLKMDHKKVDHLFKLFEKSKIEQRQKEIVALISKELLVHARSEQETFYKELAKYPASNEVATHGKKEHAEIEEQLNNINKANKKNWHQEVIALKELVQHHVSEEEGKIFRKARQVLSDKMAVILKEKMHYLKGTFLTWLNKEENKSLKKKAS
jgi:hemerythrin superfamily protein